MKICLIFEDKEILIETPCDISIKALKKQLSSHLSIDSDKLTIMNDKEVLDENFTINKEEGLKKYIIFKKVDVGNPIIHAREIQFKLEESNELEDLIMKVTGAKKKLSSKKGKFKNKLSSIDNRLEIMNQLLTRYSIPRSSSLLRQEFESIISQSNNVRESLNSEENVQINSNNSNNTNQTIFNPFVRNQNPLLNSLRNLFEESNMIGQSVSSNNSIRHSLNHFIPQINPFRRMSVQPDLQLIKNLVDMGFSEDQAKRALSLTGNNLNAAADLILSNENLEELANPVAYSQSLRVPSNIYFNPIDRQSANRFQSFNMVFNNNTGSVNNNTTNNTNANNSNVLSTGNTNSNMNNINIESNSSLSIFNNLEINNNNLMIDDSNFSYQEQ